MKWFEEKAIDHIDEEEVKERYSCDNLFVFNDISPWYVPILLLISYLILFFLLL